jgi:hypothetical protein
MSDLMTRLATAVWGEAGDRHGTTILETVFAELDAAGYQIVPKVPTEAMIDAGESQDREAAPWSGYSTEYARCEDHYAAMLAAAPKVTE